MSHFSVLIEMPKDLLIADHAAVSKYISKVMDRYDENKEVPEYETECHCVGVTARDDIFKILWADIEVLREIFRRAFGSLKDSSEIWEKYLRKPREEMTQELLQLHPKNKEPNVNCAACNGTGKRKTTYNPDSKWDWYRVGGRWDGWCKDNEPQDGDGFNFHNKHETLENNHATGEHLCEHKKVPYALIPTTGEWRCRGKMGWWGCSTCEIDETNWEEMCFAYFAERSDSVFVVLDCHI